MIEHVKRAIPAALLLTVLLAACSQRNEQHPATNPANQGNIQGASTVTQPANSTESLPSRLASLKERCLKQTGVSGRILFTRAFTDTDAIPKYDLFYYDLNSHKLEPALDTPSAGQVSPLGYTSQGLLLPGRVGGRLSPDGKRIAYYDFTSIIVGNSDGSNPQKVDTSMVRLSEAIQWSPDSLNIAYVDFLSQTARIATLSGTVSIQNVKPDVPGLAISSFSWARTNQPGDRLYSAGCLLHDAVKPDCIIVSASYLKTAERPVPLLIGSNATQPRWSPTDDLIAMLAINQDSTMSLVLNSMTGSEPVKIVTGNFSGGFDWSPDGCHIVMTRANQDKLTVVDLAKSTTNDYSIPDTLQLLYPQWVK